MRERRTLGNRSFHNEKNDVMFAALSVSICHGALASWKLAPQTISLSLFQGTSLTHVLLAIFTQSISSSILRPSTTHTPESRRPPCLLARNLVAFPVATQTRKSSHHYIQIPWRFFLGLKTQKDKEGLVLVRCPGDEQSRFSMTLFH